MSPLELAVVQRKLSHLEELLELLLHLSVEAASDLLEHLLVQERKSNLTDRQQALTARVRI